MLAELRGFTLRWARKRRPAHSRCGYRRPAFKFASQPKEIEPKDGSPDELISHK